MTNNQHGQVPEALIDLIDAYAETRHRYGGIYNARTEAARKTVIEALSGVQALSAAQAGAVPLTDDQLAEMMRETWGCASIAPRHAMKFARAIEAAHGIGIKGGQHGAE